MEPDEAAPARPAAPPRARGDASDALTGRLLDGRYRIGSRIARGGMASVYEAADIRLDRIVAVKIMHSGLGDDTEFAERFVREARSAAQISHPNVVAVFDQGDDQGTLFLAMEYIRGHTLRDVIRDEAPLSPGRALALLEPVVSALAAAHRAGLIHRDVKPENVLIATDGRIKVADFGLAKAVTADTQHTATGGVLIGTVSYLAPELVVDGRADPRADVYAAGVMLYELLTGRKPHEGESPIQVAYKHVHEDVPAPSASEPRLPAYVDALVARATARDRTQRPADAGILLHQLRRVAQALADGLDDDPELTADLALRAPATEPPDAEATTALGVAGSFGEEAEAPDAVDTGERPAAVAAAAVVGAAAVSPTVNPQLRAVRPGQDPRDDVAAHDDRDDRPASAAPTEGSARVALVPPRPRADVADGVDDDVFGLAESLADEPRAGAADTAQRPAAHEPFRSVPPDYTAPIATLGAATPYADEGGFDDDGDLAAAPPRRSRRGLLLLLLALLLAAGVGVGAWWFGYGRYTPAPAVLELTQANPEAKIDEAGLVAKVVDQQYDEEIGKGKVISASPAAGANVLRGGVIELVISLGKERYNVPKLVGLTEDKAQDALAEQHLTFGTSTREWSETVKEGRVISQSLKPGKRVKPGTVVDLVVSKGRQPIRFGDWSGKPAADATAALEKKGLKVDDSQQEFSDTVPEGSVISQDPASGPLFRGDTVKLVVSKGPELIEVPRVIGSGVEAARQQLEDLGFVVKTRKSGEYVGLQFVVRTDPGPGELAPKGSTITLIVV
ncbi:PASTA domain-containing protein [Nocardioides sp.]|uniref:PASTA domain-containing protein n=1 Tax=Nocardioides sp. TaxID=35761 RepID=UPI003529C4E1